MQIKHYIIPSLAFIVIIILSYMEPISQSDAYHHFADDRIIAGIPNFMNVVTNIPFIWIAVSGILIARKLSERRLQNIATTLFGGYLLLTLGSSYYHLCPNNATLLFDRIPMAIIFMSFFSFIVYDKIDPTIGYSLFVLLNILGVGTVLYWYYTEQLGEGDLRWYAMVQFFPILAIALIMGIYNSQDYYVKKIVAVFLFFGIAKLAEMLDHEIYNSIFQIISGHSIKHIFMAIASLRLIEIFRKRQQFI